MKIAVDETHVVSALLEAPPQARACYILAHGAGAAMTHHFLQDVACGLAERGIATLRFNFPYMEQGSKRPDRPALAYATIRAAVAMAAEKLPGLPLFAGGKSFGGRMTSQAQADIALPGVKGLIFLGFPLHAAGKPSQVRADHLQAIQMPMLFLQGTRDTLADLSLLTPLIAALPDAALETFEQADHSFHVPKRSGQSDAEVLAAMLDRVAAWITHLCSDR